MCFIRVPYALDVPFTAHEKHCELTTDCTNAYRYRRSRMCLILTRP